MQQRFSFSLNVGVAAFAFGAVACLPALAQDAANPATVTASSAEHLIVIKNHRFEPTEINVSAGQKIKLTVHNQDSTPEEFESHELNREKVIPAGAKAVIFIGPLKAGRYSFVGEFNEATAKGVVIAK